MPEKDNTGMGERIQSMVEDAVASMDFEQLDVYKRQVCIFIGRLRSCQLLRIFS